MPRTVHLVSCVARNGLGGGGRAEPITDARRALEPFYALLDELARHVGGPRRLGECDGRMGWPAQGVYFFFEPGEARPGGAPRVTRVGSHGVSEGSRSTLWKRLSQHRGSVRTGGGNHRGSIFRRHVGAALARRDGLDCPTWLGKQRPREPGEVEREVRLERLVSERVRAMPFLWLPVDGPATRDSERARIERGAIALLAAAPEPPSAAWLGHHSPNATVRRTGLWNVKHTGDGLDPAFLDALAARVRALRG